MNQVSCLVLAAGTGLNIGREGPFVHMAGMLAFLLMKHIPIFEVIVLLLYCCYCYCHKLVLPALL
jgi:Ca2+/Na+ antiporter